MNRVVGVFVAVLAACCAYGLTPQEEAKLKAEITAAPERVKHDMEALYKYLTVVTVITPVEVGKVEHPESYVESGSLYYKDATAVSKPILQRIPAWTEEVVTKPAVTTQRVAFAITEDDIRKAATAVAVVKKPKEKK